MHVIRRNQKTGERDLRLQSRKHYKTNTYAHEVEILLGPSKVDIHQTNHYRVVLDCGLKQTVEVMVMGNARTLNANLETSIPTPMEAVEPSFTTFTRGFQVCRTLRW